MNFHIWSGFVSWGISWLRERFSFCGIEKDNNAGGECQSGYGYCCTTPTHISLSISKIGKGRPPSVPVLKVSEETMNKISATMRNNINYGVKVSREFALGKDLKLFFKVAFLLWILSTAGACFNFLMLVYICILVSLTLPAFYNKHQDYIDRYAEIARNEIRKRCEMFDAHVLSKIPKNFSPKKKVA